MNTIMRTVGGAIGGQIAASIVAAHRDQWRRPGGERLHAGLPDGYDRACRGLPGRPADSATRRRSCVRRRTTCGGAPVLAGVGRGWHSGCWSGSTARLAPAPRCATPPRLAHREHGTLTIVTVLGRSFLCAVRLGGAGRAAAGPRARRGRLPAHGRRRAAAGRLGDVARAPRRRRARCSPTEAEARGCDAIVVGRRRLAFKLRRHTELPVIAVRRSPRRGRRSDRHIRRRPSLRAPRSDYLGGSTAGAARGRSGAASSGEPRRRA